MVLAAAGLVAGAVPLAAQATTTGTASPTASGVTRHHSTGTTDAVTFSCDPDHPGLGVLQAWFPRADIDGDQRVSRKEFLADSSTSFRTWDVNRDHRLTGQEADQARSETRNLLEVDSVRDNYLCITSNPPQRPPAGEGTPDGNGIDVIAINDANKDGVVTLREWIYGTGTRFAAIDCDGSHGISRAEAFRFGRVQSCTVPVV